MSRLKIAMLGTQGFEFSSSERQTDCYPWSELDRLENIRDYDILVLNLLDSNMTTQVNWTTFFSLFSQSNAKELLDSDGMIVLIGDPRFAVELEGQEVSFLSWSGLRFKWDGSPGDTVIFSERWQHQAYQGYVRHLTRWFYSLRSLDLDRESYDVRNLEVLEQMGIRVVAQVDRFAHNRYGKALAFSTWFEWRRKGDKPSDDPLSSSGRIVVLPQIDLSEEETLRLVLSDICGVETRRKEPEWLETIQPLPSEIDVRERMNSIRAAIETSTREFEEASRDLARVREPLRLLYESGERLERAVGEALRSLGADVEFPQSPGKEDGWISIEIDGEQRDGVLEVKGSRLESFEEKGLRQLLDWVARGVEFRRKKYKGIFVGTSSSDLPPDQRPSPFSVGWAESAQLHGIAALRGEDLFKVYRAHELGDLKTKEFWRRLFETNGVVVIADLLQDSGRGEI